MIKISIVAIEAEFMKAFTLQIGQWCFKPGLISSLVTLLLIPLFVHLGIWQLERWQEKLQQQRILESRLNENIWQFDELIPDNIDIPQDYLNALRYRQVQVEGYFLNHRQILLDNQIVNGQAGYHVITPFQPKSHHPILLIHRGWIPMGLSRETIPIIEPIAIPIALVGSIQQPLRRGIVWQKPAHSLEEWPLRIPQIDFQALSHLLSQEVFPFIVQLRPNDPKGFQTEPISLQLPADRHLGYAIQWFMIAVAAFIYYCAINCKRTTYGKSHKN